MKKECNFSMSTLCILCKIKGISVPDLERRCKISAGTISRWKRKDPSLQSLYVISQFLNVPMNIFLTNEPIETGVTKPLIADYIVFCRISHGLTKLTKTEIIMVLDCLNDIFPNYF